MRRIRLFHCGDLVTGLSVMLKPEASHHLLQVLRKKMGEQFWIFNGKGGEFEATLLCDNNKKNKKIACVQIGRFYERAVESPLHIHLGQGISRSERMDYAIQKAVELGVAQITPLLTEFCQVQLSENRIDKRVTHWQAIAISAAEQSGRCVVPCVNTPQHFMTWIEQPHDIKLVCCPRTEKNNFILSKALSVKNVAVTIGPEGGLSDSEIDAAFSHQFCSFPLGPRILRTETATVVAMSLLQQQWGDL